MEQEIVKKEIPKEGFTENCEIRGFWDTKGFLVVGEKFASALWKLLTGECTEKDVFDSVFNYRFLSANDKLLLYLLAKEFFSLHGDNFDLFMVYDFLLEQRAVLSEIISKFGIAGVISHEEEFSNGEVSNGEVSNGEVSNGEVSNGEVSNGEEFSNEEVESTAARFLEEIDSNSDLALWETKLGLQIGLRFSDFEDGKIFRQCGGIFCGDLAGGARESLRVGKQHKMLVFQVELKVVGYLCNQIQSNTVQCSLHELLRREKDVFDATVST